MSSGVRRLVLAGALTGVAACDRGDAPPIQASTQRIAGVLEHAGRQREYTLVLPAGEARPLVLALHGGGGSASQFESTSLLTPKAEAAGYAVAYLDGTGGALLSIQTWNAGACCGQARDNGVDDVGFVRALIDDLVARYPIDRRRVFATGHSNGGMMSYRLACELADRVAAIAPNASALMFDPCAPSRPVPILHAHSKLDENVPYLGGAGSGPGTDGITFPETRAMLDAWAARDACPASPQTEAQAGQTTTRWAGCGGGASIEYHLSDDGGHAWPGGLPGSAMGDTPTQVFDLNDLLLTFFSRYQLP